MAKPKTFDQNLDAKLATLRVGNAIDAGKTNALSKSIETRGKTLDVDMHACALAALELSDMHRDANSAALLLNRMPNGSRRETLAQWFAAFGNIVVSKDKDKRFVCKMLPMDECVPVDLGKAKRTPFWSAKEKVDIGAFNDAAACKMLQSFLAKAKNDKADLSPAMKALVGTIGAGFIKVAPKEMLDA